MKELFGKNACSYADIGDPAWVQKKLSRTSARWSLRDALRILGGLESYAAPFSLREGRKVDVNELLFSIRDARMKLLARYDIHPEYDEIAEDMRRVLLESGAVSSMHDPRLEEALRSFRDLLRAVPEQLTVTDADGKELATIALMPDPATKGKLRERRSTALDGSTMSSFEGDPRAWMEPFLAAPMRGRINRDLAPSEGVPAGAKRVQSKASKPTPRRPKATGKANKSKPS